jgi:hypothetical protein
MTNSPSVVAGAEVLINYSWVQKWAYDELASDSKNFLLLTIPFPPL